MFLPELRNVKDVFCGVYSQNSHIAAQSLYLRKRS